MRQPSLSKQIRSRLAHAERVAILGVGSDLRGDDGVGVKAAASLCRHLAGNPNVQVFVGGTAPENLTGAIRTFAPSHLLLIDAANLQQKPGSVALLELDQAQGVSSCTHMLPLQMMLVYLQQDLRFDCMILGIQPLSTAFGEKMSAPANAAVRRVVTALRTVFASQKSTPHA